jgi:hypothetical protein
MNTTWTEHEKEYVRANAGILKDRELAADLTRITGRAISIQGARRQRQKMGLRKKRGRGLCQLEDGVVFLSAKAMKKNTGQGGRDGGKS